MNKSPLNEGTCFNFKPSVLLEPQFEVFTEEKHSLLWQAGDLFFDSAIHGYKWRIPAPIGLKIDPRPA